MAREFREKKKTEDLLKLIDLQKFNLKPIGRSNTRSDTKLKYENISSVIFSQKNSSKNSKPDY